MSVKNISLYIFILFIFVITANAQDEKVIVKNKNHFISYQVVGDKVIFTMEAVNDFSNDIGGKFPNVDFFQIRIDVNRNGQIDKNVDTSYGSITGAPSICTQYLIDEIKSSVCGKLSSEATLRIGFGKTKNQKKKHPFYIFTIPKKELNQGGDKADLFFSIYTAGDGYTNYPDITGLDAKIMLEAFVKSLAKTITIDL
jgi:hypothetical protein